MEKQVYITEEERAKCQKVTDAFAELYEMEKIVVLDAGRYGFVELKYYKPPHGFEEDATFTDGRALFDALWQEWFDTTLYLTAKKMQLDNIIYEEVFNCLSKEKKIVNYCEKSRLCKKGGYNSVKSVLRKVNALYRGKKIRMALCMICRAFHFWTYCLKVIKEERMRWIPQA